MLDFLKIDPVAFTIPIGDGFPVYWYGIIITVGIVLGAWWAGREIEKRGQSVDDMYNGLLLVVLAGYLCARLWYVFQDAVLAGNSAAYTSFLDVINIRAGGANILGGFIGAALVGFIEQLFGFLPGRFKPFGRVAVGDEVNFLVRKVQRGLDKNTQRDQLCLQVIHPLREDPLQ